MSQKTRSNPRQERMQQSKRVTNSKPIPHIPLPFKEVIADVLKVKPPMRNENSASKKTKKSRKQA
jgi:hypothetical protein